MAFVAQVCRRKRVAGTDLERQLALSGDTFGIFEVADRPCPACHLKPLADFQRRKRRERLPGLLHEGEYILSTGL